MTLSRILEFMRTHLSEILGILTFIFLFVCFVLPLFFYIAKEMWSLVLY